MHHVSEVSLETFLDLLLDAVFIADRKGTILFVSAASQRIFGYTPEEMIGQDIIDFVHPADRQLTMQTIDDILGGQIKPLFENRYLHKDGTTVHIMWSARWSETAQARVAVARDVTEKKRGESMQAAVYAISEAAHAAAGVSAMFRQIHELVGKLLPAANFCVVLADPNEKPYIAYLADQHYASDSMQVPEIDRLFAHVIGTGESLLVTPDDAGTHRSTEGVVDVDEVPNWLGVPFQSAGGTTGALAVYNYCRAPCYSEKDRELLKFVSVQVAAAIERRMMRSELEYLAQHDPLTDLPNRTLFMDRLASALSRAERDHTRLVLLYLDLDDFKQVNDTYGHIVGDHLLRGVAHRLSESLRGMDTVCRLGGDEFVVLLEKIAAPENAVMLVDKIRTALTAPYDLDGHVLMVEPSIGLASYPENGSDEDELIRYADAAMYRSKERKAREHASSESGSRSKRRA